MMCRLLDVSRSGYDAWKHRGPSTRKRQDDVLKEQIQGIHQDSRGTYGSPRVTDTLQKQGVDVSRRRVARLMHETGITGAPSKRYKRTTDSNHSHRIEPNHLDRQFKVEAPNRVWVTDITYVRTWEGWLYLAVVIDLFSRKSGRLVDANPYAL